MKPVNLMNRRYGMLRVTGYAGSVDGRNAHWQCLCDCGQTCVVSTRVLRKKPNFVRSCGCVPRVTDYIVNRRYDLLRVTGYAGRLGTQDGHAHWYCLCDCGQTCVINGRLLKKKQPDPYFVRSCGCQTRRLGEKDFDKLMGQQRYLNPICRECNAAYGVTLHFVDRNPRNQSKENVKLVCRLCLTSLEPNHSSVMQWY